MKLRVLTLRPAACLLLWGLVATRLQTTPACGPGVGKPCFKVDRQGGELPTIGVIGLFSWLFPKDESPSNFPNPTAVRIKSWSQHSQSWIGKGVRDGGWLFSKGTVCVSVSISEWLSTPTWAASGTRACLVHCPSSLLLEGGKVIIRHKVKNGTQQPNCS